MHNRHNRDYGKRKIDGCAIDMEYYIRYPLNWKLIVGILFLTLLNTASFALTNNRDLKWIFIALSIFFLLIIAAVVAMRSLKPRRLQLGGGFLIINHNRLEADDISKIFIDGKGVVGIKPKKNRIVPIALCFEIVNSSDGIKALSGWAVNNHIDVTKTTFTRWI